MKFKIPVSVNVLSPLALKKPTEFLDAVQTLCDSLPDMKPEKWGWWEPLKRDFKSKNLLTLIPDGGSCETVYWQRKNWSKVEGSFAVRWYSRSPKVRDTHSNISFSAELEQVSQPEVVAYIKKSSVRMNADLALVDTLSDEYRAFAIESGSTPYGERFMVVTHVLRHWLPDVFWGTVFGPAYVRLLGKENLLSAPAYIVEELAPEMVYVQLTEKITDPIENYASVRSIRERFKNHFQCNAFYRSSQKYDRMERGAEGDVFAVPHFELDSD